MVDFNEWGYGIAYHESHLAGILAFQQFMLWMHKHNETSRIDLKARRILSATLMLSD